MRVQKVICVQIDISDERFSLLNANIKIAKHMIHVEEKINRLLCPEHSWKNLNNDEKILHWMDNHSIIGVKNGEDKISFEKRDLNLGILGHSWLLTLIIMIAAIFAWMCLSLSLKNICLMNLYWNLVECLEWWHLLALVVYVLSICLLCRKHRDIIRSGRANKGNSVNKSSNVTGETIPRPMAN
jgi:hypothetical protein